MIRFGRAALTGRDLADVWRDAVVFLPHFVGCACTGPHFILDRDAIEADLLAYLMQAYREAGRASLAQFVAARENESSRSSFAAWLSSLDTAKLESEDRDRLLADLESALQSLNAAGAGRNFTCE